MSPSVHLEPAFQVRLICSRTRSLPCVIRFQNTEETSALAPSTCKESSSAMGRGPLELRPKPTVPTVPAQPAELLIIFPSKIAINLGVPHLEKRRHVHHVHCFSEVCYVSLDMSGIVSGTVVITAVVMHQLMESLCAQSQSISILESICCRRLRTWQA